jgi:hypothetical protein
MFMPFWLAASADVDGMGCRVGTGITSATVRLGIYDVGSDGHPSRLLAQTSALAAATSGSDAIGSVTQVRLQPGWYYVAAVSDAAVALGRMSAGGELPGLLGPSSTNILQGICGFFAAITYGPLPDPAPTTGLTAVNAGTSVPAIFLRTQ